MPVALNALVYGEPGEITTIAKLADEGRITFREVQNFCGRGGRLRTAYFADYKAADRPAGGTSGWEIGKLAYLSRTSGRHAVENALCPENE